MAMLAAAPACTSVDIGSPTPTATEITTGGAQPGHSVPSDLPVSERDKVESGPEELSRSVRFDSGKSIDYSDAQMSGTYFTRWDKKNDGSAEVVRAADGTVVLRLEQPGKKRYIARILVIGEKAYVADCPHYDELDEAPPKLYQYDLTNGSRVEIPPPGGEKWTVWGSMLENIHGTPVWFADRSDPAAEEYRNCLVRIDGMKSELIYCPEDNVLSDPRESAGGVTVLMLPKKVPEQSPYTFEVEVSLDGKSVRKLGDDESGLASHGLSYAGWDVWAQGQRSDPLNVTDVPVLFNGPNNERWFFERAVPKSIIQCGGKVYWWQQPPLDKEDLGRQMHEWVPGETRTTVVAKSTPGGLAGGIKCSNGYLTWVETTQVEESPIDSFYYIKVGD
ncbi:hypothetical protein [Bowdeniella nasicola]|uniref:hypothetical protein n=1 Tax=Bowdeniella nasicola TaxID=208480 RepID=UPI0011615298|nr:hypothetical protein [Bowdeniella nasicola]